MSENKQTGQAGLYEKEQQIASLQLTLNKVCMIWMFQILKMKFMFEKWTTCSGNYYLYELKVMKVFLFVDWKYSEAKRRNNRWSSEATEHSTRPLQHAGRLKHIKHLLLRFIKDVYAMIFKNNKWYLCMTAGIKWWAENSSARQRKKPSRGTEKTPCKVGNSWYLNTDTVS